MVSTLSALAERRSLRVLLDLGLHMRALMAQKILDRAAQPRIGDVMRRIGRGRHVSARELVRAAGAGLDPLKLAVDRELHGLVVADLEVQKGVMLEAAPVAAEQRVGADEIDRAGDVAAVALRHYQQDLVAHLLADDRVERAREIRPAPFARAGV